MYERILQFIIPPFQLKTCKSRIFVLILSWDDDLLGKY